MLLQIIEKLWHYYLTTSILDYLWKWKVKGWLIKKGTSTSDCPIICSSPSYPLMWMSKFIVSQLPWSFVLWFSSKYKLNVSSRNTEKVLWESSSGCLILCPALDPLVPFHADTKPQSHLRTFCTSSVCTWKLVIETHSYQIQHS